MCLCLFQIIGRIGETKMYANRKHVRDNPLKVRLNDYDTATLNKAAESLGKQPSLLAYELMLKGLEELEAQLELSQQHRAA
jgi:hypothetical protein